MTRRDSLPPNLAPRGLSRIEAAAYIGIGTSKFDELVADGRMPRPKIIDKRKTWDRYALDAAYADLPNEGDDDMSGWADFQSAAIGNGSPKA